jgi:hypothetical protein
MIIENPVLNSAYTEPTRHFKFTEQGITDEIVTGRRVSAYFMPIAAAKKKGAQQGFQTGWTEDRLQENKFINQVRAAVDNWRRMGRHGITRTTKELLRYWTRPERERRLFFCQIEAIETAIYLAEVASDALPWVEGHLRDQNDQFNPGLYRLAFKMATGTGKTVIMAMLIAWQALNKLADPRSKRFTDTFLVVTPGITIRDRLRVLLPSDPESYYQQLDLLPSDRRVELGRAKIVITNFHAFLRRERGEAAKLTKTILRQAETGAFTETPAQMVNRVCRELGSKKNIVVLNDEAHHCYRAKPGEDDEKIFADEKDEVKQRDEDARVWLAGLEAVQQKLGIRAIYDLSATPFFLRGSGYDEGKLFPWKEERIKFDRLEPFPGTWIQALGEYPDATGKKRAVAVSIGPEHGTVGPEQVKEAAKEATRGLGVDLVVICGFAFDAHAGETAQQIAPAPAPKIRTRDAFTAAERAPVQYGKLTVLLAHMNPDLAMGEDLLKKTGTGNLFMVFGEPDLEVTTLEDGQLTVEVRGVDVYDPTTGQVRSASTDDIACWFLDTDYNGESFFVRHAYFTGADDPYAKLKRALKAQVDEAAWSALNSTVSRPFPPPKKGRIAVKVINHYGDEVMKVYSTPPLE